jgi:hypothetical protein
MTETIDFGRLETVPLRTAWVHEATAFTPWVAQNLDRLGDALGIPLELVQTEFRVTRFSADILARNAADGSTVLIENQLEESDHRHLGQIMAFEWIGPENYLGEWPAHGLPKRGAHVTSADAAVRFNRAGRTELALIEWKYTERSGQPLDQKGNDVREGRYKDKAFAPEGPIRKVDSLTVWDFFYEPLYQLFRQQMLAWRVQRAPENRAEKVSVLHVSAAGNLPLHAATSPALQDFGDDVFKVFRGLLVEPETFVSCTTEHVFGPYLTVDYPEAAAREWADYLRDRYTFLSAS